MANNRFIILGNLELVFDKNYNSVATLNTKITELTNEIIALKEQIAKTKTATTEPLLPNGYVLAKDSDFEWRKDFPYFGAWHYIGTADKVAIPHTIQGKEVTSYRGMFYKTSVSGVYSNNKNVTNMSYMFQDSKATSLDLSNFDTSNVTDMINMFSNSKATTLDLSSFDTSNITNMIYMSGIFYRSVVTKGYARTQEDADKFNIPFFRSRLRFVVKPQTK